MSKLSFLSQEEIERIGFKRVGKNLSLDRSVFIIGAENIESGDNVRIDVGAVILAKKGYLKLGSNIHISSGVRLSCSGGIEIRDYCTVSFGSSLISSSDNFDGDYLVGPQNDVAFTNVNYAPIIMEKHSHVTAHCCVMPGVFLGEGVVLGANSLARAGSVFEPWHFYWGSPAVKQKSRKRGVLKLESSI
jgi:acetyltransferase-like isoleucine patch superfamily enzyme